MELPLTLGTENAVYIENCIFTNTTGNSSAIDGWYGSRIVFRRNTLNHTQVQTHSARATPEAHTPTKSMTMCLMGMDIFGLPLFGLERELYLIIL